MFIWNMPTPCSYSFSFPSSSLFLPSSFPIFTMHSGLIWCYICCANGTRVSDEDLFSVDRPGWEDDMMNTNDVINNYLQSILPAEEAWQFEIGADAFSGLLDYSLSDPLPNIPPFTFSLRDQMYTIYFPSE
jgi:hypothetical protein